MVRLAPRAVTEMAQLRQQLQEAREEREELLGLLRDAQQAHTATAYCVETVCRLIDEPVPFSGGIQVGHEESVDQKLSRIRSVAWGVRSVMWARIDRIDAELKRAEEK